MEGRANEVVKVAAVDEVGQVLVQVLLRPRRAAVAAVAVKDVDDSHVARRRAVVLDRNDSGRAT